MPAFALHSLGRPFSSDTPDASGPRQCGQSSAWSVTVSAPATSTADKTRLGEFMGGF